MHYESICELDFVDYGTPVMLFYVLFPHFGTYNGTGRYGTVGKLNAEQ